MSRVSILILLLLAFIAGFCFSSGLRLEEKTNQEVIYFVVGDEEPVQVNDNIY